MKNIDSNYALIKRPIKLIVWLCVLLIIPTSAAQSYQQKLLQQLPINAHPQFFFGAISAQTVAFSGQTGAYEYHWLRGDGEVNSAILRIETLKQTDHAWNVVMHSASNSMPIKKDQWVMVSFKARISPGAKTANLHGYVESNQPNWIGIATVSFKATSQWQQVIGVARATQNFDKNAVTLSVHLGLGKQSIDIAELALISLASDVDEHELPVTPLQFDSKAKDKPWQKQAQTMIEQHRKGLLKLKLVDTTGQTLSGAHVTFKQRRSDYQFGSFVSQVLTNNTPITAQYQQWFSDYFNVATTPVYWADWGWDNPERQQDYIAMAGYFKQHNIPARGHVLLYPGFKFSPNSLVSLKNNRQAFIEHIDQHLEKVVPLFKQLGINEFDVINELRDEVEWSEVIGKEQWLDQVTAWYQLVHRLHPTAKLYINENSILTDGGDNLRQQDQYLDLITTLLQKGAPLHGIGMQGHFSELVTPVTKLWEVLDKFATFNLPIRITEFDLSTRDYAGQGVYESDFYTAIFAHPATVGLTRWGFYEPQMWLPQGALINRLGQAKPNAKSIHQLLSKTWMSEGRAISDVKGRIEADVFYGEYVVEIEHGDKHQGFLIDFANPAFITNQLGQAEFELVFTAP